MIVLVCSFTTLIVFFKDNFELLVSILGNILVAFIAFGTGSNTQRRITMENNHNDPTLFAPQEMLSPFDAIKETDGKGREWWNSRKLARLLGYQKYFDFLEFDIWESLITYDAASVATPSLAAMV